ncbi:SidA/IucD/PvdA family monooxygenase [Jiella sp. MQZ9-1]|uniref:SidA/IucD/PvdA family monooxygenase n=1 Tax=Jiella flava TaxID=2816857 RepID=A0A939FZD9_9HYPH|nr:SidA/IucD/PvdA family monooxygenase [Jiella flava]MBO0662312.1 SidA/IucD/PvdA family monooxygenase [Jiella flava]MCD2470857.1 SidA/IucD/PvdA family monooxygenase [Jiella flava]
MTQPTKPVELAGIGIGPFNLSLAALADGVPGLATAFFERNVSFAWHPGLCFSDSILQTSPLKDLVTPVCPTNPWSFLNYLVEKGRFFDFMSARFETVSRLEFSAYMAWAAEGLASAHFDAAVDDVDFVDGLFRLRVAGRPDCWARALAIGTGRVPLIPAGVAQGPECFHASRYLEIRPAIAGRRVAVIGGGQSGAEVVLNLLQQEGAAAPASIAWVSRRDGFWTLQEGGLVDQFFTPGYLAAYREMPLEVQARALASQKFASDGLTASTADELYRLLYRRRYLEGRDDVALYPGRELSHVRPSGRGQAVVSTSAEGTREVLEVDVVVLATGYRAATPNCLEPLARRLAQEPDGALALGESYRTLWDGPASNPIYGLNHGRRSYGVIDPQLSMAAWRSAVILNDVCGRQVFRLAEPEDGGLVTWRGNEAGQGADVRLRSGVTVS